MESVTTAKLAPEAVTTPKIGNGAVTRAKLSQDVQTDIDSDASIAAASREEKYEPTQLPTDGADFQQIALPLAVGENFGAGEYSFLFYDDGEGFTHDDAFTATFEELNAATADAPHQLGLDPNASFNDRAFYAYIGEAGGLPALFWDWRNADGNALPANGDIQLQEVTVSRGWQDNAFHRNHD